jgi:hypothetical protein
MSNASNVNSNLKSNTGTCMYLMWATCNVWRISLWIGVALGGFSSSLPTIVVCTRSSFALWTFTLPQLPRTCMCCVCITGAAVGTEQAEGQSEWDDQAQRSALWGSQQRGTGQCGVRPKANESTVILLDVSRGRKQFECRYAFSVCY